MQVGNNRIVEEGNNSKRLMMNSKETRVFMYENVKNRNVKYSGTEIKNFSNCIKVKVLNLKCIL